MRLHKRLAAHLPTRWQSELRRIHFGRQIAKGTFQSPEPEYKILPRLITQGDWVIDVGANVGHYTKRFSELVGPRGRVIAFEPVPSTFSLLAANVQLFAYKNVTLINAAASDKLNLVSMSIPQSSTGLPNYYQARVSRADGGAFSVLALPIDSLRIGARIALVKIDAEGHESLVLAGMHALLEEHHPVLIVENGSQAVLDQISSLRYAAEHLSGSPNVVFSSIT